MFVPTDALYAVAENEGLKWRFEDLPGTVLGYYVENKRLILLNRYIASNEPLLRETFTEEIGHAFTLGINPYCYNPSYIARVLDARAERMALRWAVNYLIDTESFVSHYSCYGCFSDCSRDAILYHLSQEYGVTSRFILLKESLCGDLARLNRVSA